jgi:ribosome biogenesis GTPase / thiamine phosphate phosphatase
MSFNREVERRYTKKEAAKLDSKFRRTPRRILIKKDGILTRNARKGIVVAAMGKAYLVEDTENGLLVDCSPAGTIISDNDITSLIAVGDYIYYSPGKTADGEELTGKIIKVEQRDYILSRKAVYIHGEHVVAANCAFLLIIMAAADPYYNKRLIDRFIVSAEQGDMKPAICINKMDLMDRDFIEEDMQIYRKLEIPIFYTSTVANQGIDELRNFLGSSSTVLSGPSGVGKSTIINHILGEEIQSIGDVSESSGKGMHTTSFVRMLKLPGGGSVVDTPGIREFGLIRMDKVELPLFFHDFDDYYNNCRYMPCSHTHEPGCAVKAAVEEGKIDPERYISYVNIYESIE